VRNLLKFNSIFSTIRPYRALNSSREEKPATKTQHIIHSVTPFHTINQQDSPSFFATSHLRFD